MNTKINNAVILAAGKGSRLSLWLKKNNLKILAKINNKTLILENIKNIKKNLKVKKIFIIGGYNFKILKKFFKTNKNVKLINNTKWKKGNGYSLDAALKYLKNDTFFLLAGDHFFSKNFYKSILKSKVQFGLACSKNLSFFHDINDATKIFSKKNIIYNIGKKIKKFNGFDTGFFIINKRYLNSTKKTSISQIIKNAKNKIKRINVNSNDWIDLDTKTDIKNFKIAIKQKIFHYGN